MKLAILILKDEDKLDLFIKKCTSENIKNITVLDSESYEKDKSGKKRSRENNIFNSIRYIIDYYNDESRTILIPVKDEKLNIIKEILSNHVSSNQYTLLVLNLEETIGLE